MGGKESFIKAWSQAIYGQPPVIAEEAVVWRDIEVRADAWGASRSNWRPNWPQWSGNPSGVFQQLEHQPRRRLRGGDVRVDYPVATEKR